MLSIKTFAKKIATASILLCLVSSAFAVTNYPDQLLQQATQTFQLSTHTPPTASLIVGNRLFQQSKFKQAYAVMLPWAKQGNQTAQLEIGFMNEFGQGVPQSYQKAALWYFLAIRPNQFNGRPMQRAINAYFGLNQKVDYQTAALWFRMAAELSVDRY